MSTKNQASFRTRLLPVCHYLPALLVFALAAGISAQPADNNTWNTTVSFSGTGNLDLTDEYGPQALIPLTISTSGTGVNTADANGFGGFTVNSSFNSILTLGGLPNGNIFPPDLNNDSGFLPPNYAPFNITGSDPGPTFAASQSTVTANSSPPFYGLFPPPSGAKYTSVLSGPAVWTTVLGSDNTPVYFQINFNDSACLTLGSTPTLTVTPDLLQMGYSYYTYSYADSRLALPVNVQGGDPPVDFTGTFVDTTLAPTFAQPAVVPEPGTWIMGVAMLAPFGISTWQALRKRKA